MEKQVTIQATGRVETVTVERTALGYIVTWPGGKCAPFSAADESGDGYCGWMLVGPDAHAVRTGGRIPTLITRRAAISRLRRYATPGQAWR